MKTAKDSIDLGIVVSDGAKALAFYRDALGLEQIGEQPMQAGGRMYRLLCGASHIKIATFPKTPAGKAAPGGPFEALAGCGKTGAEPGLLHRWHQHPA
jgi:catechol 2,3-dioxygenase-like lactoylglutathione lyase family enzyme